MRRVEIVERLRLKGRLDVLVFVIIAVLGTPSLGLWTVGALPDGRRAEKGRWDSGLSRPSAATRRRET
jgi:hypothetical protein